MKSLTTLIVALGLVGCSLIPKPELNITEAKLNPISETMQALMAKA